MGYGNIQTIVKKVRGNVMKIKLRPVNSKNRTEIEIDNPKDVAEDSIRDFETPNTETAIQEEVLKRVFQSKEEIGDICDVFHKCTILNIYYSTQIKDKDLLAMARRIISLNNISYNNMGLVDYLLFFETDQEKYRRLVNLIAYYKDNDPDNVSVGNCYSFASKFCSWHSPEKFPIVDSYAKGLLYRITEEKTARCVKECEKEYMKNLYRKMPGKEIEIRKKQCYLYNHGLNDYCIYCELYDCFLEDKEFGLSELKIEKKLRYKKIDEYMWQYSNSLFKEDSRNFILNHLPEEKRKEEKEKFENEITKLMNDENEKKEKYRRTEEQVRKQYIDKHYVPTFTISPNYEIVEEILKESKNAFGDIFN